ncbi:hypothetical protein CLOM_g5552 [Closterium sp. NIES-68]|nr:hypothetical protein CLOM_g5552 [Closterium sp. NIES-68]GJP77975.1 hypothetical protein CLOP_g8293 [Closterium sp. NIES-67]
MLLSLLPPPPTLGGSASAHMRAQSAPFRPSAQPSTSVPSLSVLSTSALSVSVPYISAFNSRRYVTPFLRGVVVSRLHAGGSGGGGEERPREDSSTQLPGPLPGDIPSFPIPNSVPPFRGSPDFPGMRSVDSGVAPLSGVSKDESSSVWPSLAASTLSELDGVVERRNGKGGEAANEGGGGSGDEEECGSDDARAAGLAGPAAVPAGPEAGPAAGPAAEPAAGPAAGQEQTVGVKWLAKARQQALPPDAGDRGMEAGKSLSGGEGQSGNGGGGGGESSEEPRGVRRSPEDGEVVLAAEVERFVQAFEELKREAVSLGIPGYALPRVEREEDPRAMVKKLVEARNEVLGIMASRLSSNL